jgi:L-ascorbate metabolism protein UlaG (beta-lactamase superfamily)
MNPEEAVQAHRDLNGESADPGVLVPIHWATFRLAPHPWADPAERLVDAAEAAGVDIAVPKPGGRVVPSAPTAVDRWWQL